ncbi:prenyltransferase/squalene oxidase repeat-containing protein [Tuwongella immobilis]|uniref:Prenyltransferase alpha-alpha toroid domain-containing protein n=1 Tax=Tuwongella immobilis TaxID=692036 RepID=A0A6C2YLQ5_9BACT|nr:prenyltransferase/squalene oxidase repeat-containing protein [Tuwongella immobilis]VIP02025.1 Putative peptidase OS=Singulisphaera acidiphila (strain ATCC BAA-1392 / DSM 18658 / VKM B-2454 / MOB10) GN=Sinac_5574 PE=4 SV=1: Prenyltrans_2 [Tuwongella immobilis]VTS00162.1 Putative peptidase OS=Singulisphaera acidiphila (strain ATCC BAA-1392 / DSM 18658 / VKM B-2454 / MOB10) GN=Sinac_5574 PE=4 SV=1: Prenyltrans_2 [Tuwongella immobilis]
MYRMMLILVIVLAPFGLLNRAIAAIPEAESAATLAYIQSCRLNNGTFAMTPELAKSGKATLMATSLGLRASKYWGKPIDATPELAKFVDSCFDAKSGGFADVPGGKPAIPVTAIALTTVVELKMDVSKYQASAVRYLAENVSNFEEVRIAVAGIEMLGDPREILGKTRAAWIRLMPKVETADGWLRDARTLGGTLVALARVGEVYQKPERIAGFTAVLQAGQRADGGFGIVDQPSEMASTYRVMRAFDRYGQIPEDMAKLREFMARCRNADGGYGVQPNTPSNLSGVYYVGIVEKWLKEAIAARK